MTTTMGRPKNQQLLVDDDSSSLCRKHRWQRRPGVCAHCLSERLQRLFCADCGLQKALPSSFSYSSSSSSSSSSFSCRCTSSSLSLSSSSSWADTDTETEANIKSLLERNASVKCTHIHGGVIAPAAAALLQKAVPTPTPPAVAETPCPERSLRSDPAAAWSRHRSCSAAVASTRTGTMMSMSMRLSDLSLVPQAEPQNPSNSMSPSSFSSSSASASSWRWALGFLWKKKKKKEKKINDNGNCDGIEGVGKNNKGTSKLDLEVAAQRLAKSRSLAMRRRSLSSGLQDFQGMSTGVGFGLPPQSFCPTPAPSAMDDHKKAADSSSSFSSGWSLSGTAKALRKSPLWR